MTVAAPQNAAGADLSGQDEELARQERALQVELARRQADLEAVVLQRCALAHARRAAALGTPDKQKQAAVNWKKLLNARYQKRKAVKQAREEALAELHLVRGWISWRDRTQILVAFQLSKQDPSRLFWVKNGLLEILPHLELFAARPGYKLVGICHTGPYNMRYFLLCAADNSMFLIEDAHRANGNPVLFQGTTLDSALEYAQRHFAA